LRDTCVALLMRQLEGWAEQPDGLNGFLIHDLVELRAVESAPLMEAAFEGGGVDLMIRGDWQDVQVDLGLLAERTTPRKPLNVLERLRLTPPPGSSPPVPPGAAARARRKEDKRRKAKRKRK
jgi:hypothetical protein